MKSSLLTSVSSAALCTGWLLTISGHAEAGYVCGSDSCTDTESSVLTKTEWAGAAPPAGSGIPLSLQLFVPATDQNLKSVVVSEGGSVSTVGNVKNTAPNAQTFHFTESLAISVMATGNTPANFPLATTTAAQIYGSHSQKYTNLATNASSPFSWSASLTPYDPATITSGLSAYIGTGIGDTFTVVFDSVTGQGSSGAGGNAVGTLTTSGIADVSITYNFTTSVPVPEPGGVATLGSGLAGLGVLRRRRKN